MVRLNREIKELVKQKGFYKLYLKKAMKAQNIKKKQLLGNPKLIE
jgi:hypothetical protein